MKRRKSKHTKKIRDLVIVSSLCAIILTVSTYAWFVGMKTVNVSSFDIDIATTEGLWLSMNGNDWSYRLDAKSATAYTGNTNSWAESGLIPLSTIGDMDSVASRMKLYEKGSFTTTKGGYRLLTSRVHNNDVDGAGFTQGKGYVVFDLFIKNLSGTEYYTTNEPDNEEAIYLTTNSKVSVASTGVAGTGIENSVRVAFAQIGRVKADTNSASNITSITCSDLAASEGQVQVTGICRNAQIWEPNDTLHVANATKYYDTSCRQRKTTGTDVTLDTSYDTTAHCGTFENTNAYATYAISRALNVEDQVDVYDGEIYNSYKDNTDDYATYIAAYNAAASVEGATEESIATDMKDYKLIDFPYFTDTMKNLTSTQRPTFMTLAPNSITKVRIYVFIEGQDVDNYDFASLGQKISVQFGFTKERYTETDIQYSGPSTDITDDSVTTTNQ